MNTPADGRTILIVEDEPALSSVLAKFLQKAGYRSVICDCGAAALEYAAKHTPDAIVTDVHLPDLNGLVLTQKFRQRYGDAMPIIVLSGDTSMEVIKTLPHVGATHFFNKPLNPDVLMQHLSKFFEKAA